MKPEQFFDGVFMEPIGYMGYDRCQICGADVRENDASATNLPTKSAHLLEHEAAGDIERAGPTTGWRLCFGRTLKPVPQGVPEAEFAADMARAQVFVEAHTAALLEVADEVTDAVGNCACGRSLWRVRAHRLKDTGAVVCFVCVAIKAKPILSERLQPIVTDWLRATKEGEI